MNEFVLAEWLHINYEEISKKENWETQKICKVKFEDLPRENVRVMVELAKRLINKKDLKFIKYVCPICNYEFDKKEDCVECCGGKE